MPTPTPANMNPPPRPRRLTLGTEPIQPWSHDERARLAQELLETNRIREENVAKGKHISSLTAAMLHGLRGPRAETVAAMLDSGLVDLVWVAETFQD